MLGLQTRLVNAVVKTDLLGRTCWECVV